METWVLIALGLVVVLGIAVVVGSRGRQASAGPFGEGSGISPRTTVTLASGSGETPDAQRIAAALRAATGGAATTTTTHIEVVDGGQRVIDAREVPGLREAVLRALADHGIDVQDAAASEASGRALPPASGAAHDVELLEHLAELHRSGALTDAEFEAAKRRILAD